LAMLAGRIVTPLDGALVGVAALTLQEELQPLAPALPADGPRVSCHVDSSDSPALWRPAAVVRDGGDVLDQVHHEARGLEAAERGLAPRPGSLDEDLHLPHAELGRLARRGLGRDLGGEGRALARALEAHRAGARPCDHAALRV